MSKTNAFTRPYPQYDTSNGYGNSNKWKQTFHTRMGIKEAIEILSGQADTPHAILGVSIHATQDEIRKAYINLIKIWFPDWNMHREHEANEMCKKINAAYAMLYK